MMKDRVLRSVAGLALGVAMLAVSAVAPLAERAHACSCVPSTVETRFERATVVFSGTVDSVRADGDAEYPRTVTRFTVHRLWKGEPVDSIEVRSAVHSATCGMQFSGGPWLIYAWNGPDGLTTGLCSGNTLMEDAAEDLAQLGEGYPPAGAEQPSPPSETPADDSKQAPGDGCMAAPDVLLAHHGRTQHRPGAGGQIG